tara:strand:- start:262 stop:639 length:378 start_codon:yes stop_codon:yes gene_type:complete
MDFAVERIRLTNQEKGLLTRMKGATGLDNWNIFARWAFCYSLSMKEKISVQQDEESSFGIEMTWMVFAGKNFKIYQDLLVQECLALDLKPNKSNLNKVMRAHLSNGIKKMYSQVSCLDDFMDLAK